ncbi:hypothetical protein FZI85_16555 [Mycobacterium sp. CBMA293]|uniref:hypothetical protein n=1 Tax=unclassified Mycolicibacterium TaxID=2636767 RepID=UPI0012DBE162|nr:MULTISPECIES: hypothetical protein [unclassified Mycolicibacterium]MUL44339.1 hypothetical protein [Mycolicibacterium sp. CBMA 360]MUL59657.1 hypothetical protein [Mycolicibacterium sp. CBMA 335]MUL68500.1 hypothetical protein [Mycolicibacterium sp. CBMA 311]MUL97153.1 hypothetical protein [Mycolicibacterium sp. CBMA 230]MUM06355.1 hypothetical protein [Mycolicibacterium sp. CBMA 213]
MKRTVSVVAGVLTALAGAPAATAEPPNFPDLSNFGVETNSHQTTDEGTSRVLVKFSTPDGLSCGMGALGGLAPSVRCYGPVPGIEDRTLKIDPNAATPCDFGVAVVYTANRGAISSYRGDCPTDLAGGAPLAPGQKVTLGTATCGVVPGGITACIDKADGGHGFVLQPAGSWVF